MQPNIFTRIQLVQGDITRQQIAAIVNAANSDLLGGGGVDGTIHRAGGPAILDECRLLRASSEYMDGLPTGEAVITTSGRLPAAHVVHTVGPVWHGGREGEPELLARCYRNSLHLAAEHQYVCMKQTENSFCLLDFVQVSRRDIVYKGFLKW